MKKEGREVRASLRNSQMQILLSLFIVVALGVLAANAQATSYSEQQTTQSTSTQTTTDKKPADKQINVNWLYGSFVPKDVPIIPLTPKQRFHLYLRQTYITPGIYAKTVLFTLNDQRKNTPPQWDGGFSGFGKRLLSYQGQFIIQNSISSLGNGFLRWEPRYDLCRCEGIKPRIWHAVKRNFITYNSTDTSWRPQLMPYAGAAGAAAISAATWQPGNQNPGIKAYQAAITQIFVGVGVNLLAEFAPDVKRMLGRDKKDRKKKDAGQQQQ
ncbi:MAG TPA: hypothetical protein VFL42_02875 [Terriglobales bacterium]|jgi:hypothetical protein|nr:hypothetical protein [Terriglobales bacterium]